MFLLLVFFGFFSTNGQCARQHQIDYFSIMNCVNGQEGSKLQHQMALMTKALNPPHEYVPWVTLNGIHTEQIQLEAQNHLLKLICDTYKVSIALFFFIKIMY